jgi:hypothetical protein
LNSRLHRRDLLWRIQQGECLCGEVSLLCHIESMSRHASL